MKHEVEFFPPGYNRYPLPAHQAGEGHTLAHCGDPEWCLHENISPAGINIKVEPIPTATKPALIFIDEAKKYKNKIDVDAKLISDELKASGFKEEDATSFAILIHDKKARKNNGADGWYDSYGYYNASTKQQHNIAINVVFKEKDMMNKTAWHEFGHAHEENVAKVSRKALYNNRTIVNRLKSYGIASSASGIAMEPMILFQENPNRIISAASTFLIGYGAITALFPEKILWQFDKGEKYATKFARQRRNLKPISVKK